jgi:hypothetical protein
MAAVGELISKLCSEMIAERLFPIPRKYRFMNDRRSSSMLGSLSRFLGSRFAWTLGVIGWIWVAGRGWLDALSGDASSLDIAKLVIATVLALTFAIAFVVRRGWKSHEDGQEH